jgi:hypothetical protein
MEFRFRRIKTDAKAIRAARANGIDPMTLDMDNGLCKGTGGPDGLRCFHSVSPALSHDHHLILYSIIGLTRPSRNFKAIWR